MIKTPDLNPIGRIDLPSLAKNDAKILADDLARTDDPFVSCVAALNTLNVDEGEFDNALDAGYFKRKFAIDGGYPHPRLAAKAMVSSNWVLDGDKAGNGPSAKAVGRIGMRTWSHFGHPFYFISPELEKALSRTNVPDIPVSEMKLPFGAVMIGFKDGSMVIAVECEEMMGKSFFTRPVKAVGTAMSWVGGGVRVPEIGKMHFEDADRFTAEFEVAVPLLHKAIAVLFFLVSRAEYKESLHTRTVVRKASKDKLEMVKPRIVGANYKVRTTGHSESSSGGKVAHHWRCGHFKVQRFGKGRSDSKVIWIEPYEVN